MPRTLLAPVLNADLFPDLAQEKAALRVQIRLTLLKARSEMRAFAFWWRISSLGLDPANPKAILEQAKFLRDCSIAMEVTLQRLGGAK